MSATLSDVGLCDHKEIDIVDVLVGPKRALAKGIFMTPTLVVAPSVCRIVGTLRQTQTVLLALGLKGVTA